MDKKELYEKINCKLLKLKSGWDYEDTRKYVLSIYGLNITDKDIDKQLTKIVIESILYPDNMDNPLNELEKSNREKLNLFDNYEFDE